MDRAAVPEMSLGAGMIGFAFGWGKGRVAAAVPRDNRRNLLDWTDPEQPVAHVHGLFAIERQTDADPAGNRHVDFTKSIDTKAIGFRGPVG